MARNASSTAWRSRAACRRGRWKRSARPPTGAAHPSPSTPTRRSSARSASSPRGSSRWRAPRRISSPGSSCAGRSAIDDGETPAEAKFRFPGGLADYLDETLAGATTYAERPFAGRVEFSDKFGEPGRVEWAINWTPARDGFLQSYCNTVPTPEGGTHEAGFWAAILKGIKAHGERANNRKAAQITREDLVSGGCALVSCFIREPEFVGQTKDRLATVQAQRMVENAVRDHFDNWLASDTKSAGAILDFLVLRAEERQRRRAEKETARKTATKKAAPARQAGGLHRDRARRHRALHRRGR